MIRVRMDFLEYAMEMKGHANAPREGELDLVCCAASTLGQLLLYSLEEYKAQHGGITRIDETAEPGHLKVKVRCREWARVAVKTRMDMIREGMEMLQERYPEYIMIEEEME